MSFDFSLYLARIDPHQKYVVTKLTGGIVNVTARAVRVSMAETVPSRFEATSVILKYAPPYVAGRGETAPMSQSRQVTEALALSLLAAVIPPGQSVDIPRLLLYDSEAHVLVISDLGILPNLTEAFSALGGYSPITGPPDQIPHPPVLDQANVEEYYYAAIGNKLGRFFAMLHSPRTIELVRSKYGGIESFANPSMRLEVFDHSIKPVRDKLKLFPELISHAEADQLYHSIEGSFLLPLLDEEQSLTLGDCWTAAILVDPDESNPDPKVGVVDWEFSSIGRGVDGDIAQLLAHFELLYITAEHNGLPEYSQVLDLLVESLVHKYKKDSLTQGAAWTKWTDGYVHKRLLKSLLVSHACEMINCAFWKVWTCHDETCMNQKGSHANAQQNCVLVKKIVKRAIWYLGYLNSEVDAAVDNIAAVAGDNGGGLWLLDLLKK